MRAWGAVKNYDLDRLSVATIASHTSLQILRGAKRAGFKTIAVAKTGRGWFYKRFGFIDEVLEIDLSEFVKASRRLLDNNAVLVPHGSLVEYVGHKAVIETPVPLFGNRWLVEWEADQSKKMSLLRRSGLRTPREYKSVEEVDGPVIVKLYGAKGGRGYVLARGRDELREKLSASGLKPPYLIQEYVVGVPAYYHYFASRVYGRVELFGMDVRYESNVDGRLLGLEEPSFVVVGNQPLVLRESLLPEVVKHGESFAKTVEELVPPGLIGPFCLESIIKDDLSIVFFEFSGRIVAGTNVYMGVGSVYSTLYFDKPIDMGERIALELREAIKKGVLDRVLT